jgi:hypothetical protein
VEGDGGGGGVLYGGEYARQAHAMHCGSAGGQLDRVFIVVVIVYKLTALQNGIL